ncbi:MAG: hypothetical protein P8Q36_18750 [Alphaproteobacteria bacterium]|nr:hypothetical protein [Alphaproteobacteria bacterium]
MIANVRAPAVRGAIVALSFLAGLLTAGAESRSAMEISEWYEKLDQIEAAAEAGRFEEAAALYTSLRNEWPDFAPCNIDRAMGGVPLFVRHYVATREHPDVASQSRLLDVVRLPASAYWEPVLARIALGDLARSAALLPPDGQTTLSEGEIQFLKGYLLVHHGIYGINEGLIRSGLTELVDLDPSVSENAVAYQTIGTALVLLRFYEDARTNLEKSLEQTDDVGDSYFSQEARSAASYALFDLCIRKSSPFYENFTLDECESSEPYPPDPLSGICHNLWH